MMPGLLTIAYGELKSGVAFDPFHAEPRF